MNYNNNRSPDFGQLDEDENENENYDDEKSPRVEIDAEGEEIPRVNPNGLYGNESKETKSNSGRRKTGRKKNNKKKPTYSNDVVPNWKPRPIGKRSKNGLRRNVVKKFIQQKIKSGEYGRPYVPAQEDRTNAFHRKNKLDSPIQYPGRSPIRSPRPPQSQIRSPSFYYFRNANIPEPLPPNNAIIMRAKKRLQNNLKREAAEARDASKLRITVQDPRKVEEEKTFNTNWTNLRNNARKIAKNQNDTSMMRKLKQKMTRTYLGFRGLGGIEDNVKEFDGDKSLTPDKLREYIKTSKLKIYLKKLNEKMEIGQNLGINFSSLPTKGYMMRNPNQESLDTLDRLILEARIRRNQISGRQINGRNIWTINDDRTVPFRLPENFIGTVDKYTIDKKRRKAKFLRLQSKIKIDKEKKRKIHMEAKMKIDKEKERELMLDREKSEIWVKKKTNKKKKKGESMQYWTKVGEMYDKINDIMFINLKPNGTGKIKQVLSTKFDSDYVKLVEKVAEEAKEPLKEALADASFERSVDTFGFRVGDIVIKIRGSRKGEQVKITSVGDGKVGGVFVSDDKTCKRSSSANFKAME